MHIKQNVSVLSNISKQLNHAQFNCKLQQNSQSGRQTKHFDLRGYKARWNR